MEDNSDEESVHPMENIACFETIIDLDESSVLESIFEENDTDNVTSVETKDCTS